MSYNKLVKLIYLFVYIGFNVFFGIIFVIGFRALLKLIRFKKRLKYFTVPGKARYLRQTRIKSKLIGTSYRYYYEVKVGGTTLETTIDSIANDKIADVYDTDKDWFEVKVNPENHSEIRLLSEDKAIRYYRLVTIFCLGYGLFCRLLFEFMIWTAFLEEGGLK